MDLNSLQKTSQRMGRSGALSRQLATPIALLAVLTAPTRHRSRLRLRLLAPLSAQLTLPAGFIEVAATLASLSRL